jgi:hypothetical protein
MFPTPFQESIRKIEAYAMADVAARLEKGIQPFGKRMLHHCRTINKHPLGT